MKDVKIVLSHEANQKLKYYVNSVDGEISGLGKSEVVVEGEEKTIFVTDFAIFKQKCTSSFTSIEDEAIAKFIYELRQKGEDPKHWNLWWHSHNTMAVFWSVTDTQTILDRYTLDYLVSIVTNKRGEFKARVDIFPEDKSPFKQTIFKTYDDIKVYLQLDPVAEEEKETLLNQKKELISEHEELIKLIDTRIKEIDSVNINNPELKRLCEEEVKEKVETTSYTRKNIPIIGDYGKRRLIGTTDFYGHRSSFFDKKKPEKSLSVYPEKENYESILEDIYGATPNRSYYENYCEDCMELKIHCMCKEFKDLEVSLSDEVDPPKKGNPLYFSRNNPDDNDIPEDKICQEDSKDKKTS